MPGRVEVVVGAGEVRIERSDLARLLGIDGCVIVSIAPLVRERLATQYQKAVDERHDAIAKVRIQCVRAAGSRPTARGSPGASPTSDFRRRRGNRYKQRNSRREYKRLHRKFLR